MKSGFFLVLLAAFLLIESAPAIEVVNIDGRPAVNRHVLARLKGRHDVAARDQLLTAHGARIVRHYTIVPDLVLLELEPTPRLNSSAVLPPDPDREGRALAARIKALQITGLFRYAEPDFVQQTAVIPSDTAYVNGTLWGLDDINAPTAWDLTTGDTNVVVAVIDTGVNYLHQDLAAQMWRNPGEVAGNGLDDDNNGYVDDIHGINAIVDGGDPLDDDGHGSHVAGTIGAAANGGGPHVGVAWNVRIMALKFLDAAGSGSNGNAIECLQYARTMGAHILNNSWGGGPYSQALFEAILATRNAAMLFVAAAGNDANDNDFKPAYPASYNADNIISVAAVDQNAILASFSNYGAQSVHLGAPGVGIFSCLDGTPTAYGTLSGTSMAAPHVSGVAALVWARLQPAGVAAVADLRQGILDGTIDTPSLLGKTARNGRLNAALALGSAPDGVLELAVASEQGQQVIAGRTTAFTVRVTDLFPVSNATVTATASFGGGTISFLDQGTGADAVGGDATYSAFLAVPATPVQPFNLSVTASAPGKNQAVASVVFTVIPPPGNDDFAGRTQITSIPAIVTASNVEATDEPGEPVHVFTGFGQRMKSLWWTWTAPSNGVYTASTDGSDFDTLLAVYTGTSLGTLVPVIANNDAGFDWTSTVTFSATAGTAYQIVVDGYYYAPVFGEPEGFTVAGGVQLTLAASPPMTNDHFTNRKEISGINVTAIGHNVGSTAEPGEPSRAGITPSRSVWWSWTAPASEVVIVSTAGSTFNTVLAVYRGTSLNTLTLVGAHDNVGDFTDTSELSFFAQAGTNYQIAVDRSTFPPGTSAQGNVRLHVARRPVNDQFAQRTPLAGEIVSAEAFNLVAGAEPGEPLLGAVFGRTVWWTWTAPRSGNATITTDGSDFDTMLAVYTGSTLGTLDLLAFNDDRVMGEIRTSLLSFAAQSGTTYQFQLDGYDSLAGRGVLSLTMDGRSSLSPPVLNGTGRATLDLVGEPDRNYVLRATSDLTSWTGVATNTAVSRRLRFEDALSPGQDTRFYRAEPASLIDNRPPGSAN